MRLASPGLLSLTRTVYCRRLLWANMGTDSVALRERARCASTRPEFGKARARDSQQTVERPATRERVDTVASTGPHHSEGSDGSAPCACGASSVCSSQSVASIGVDT